MSHEQHLTEEQFNGFVLEDLPPGDVPVIDAHLETCERCAKRLEVFYQADEHFPADEWAARRSAVEARLRAATIDAFKGTRQPASPGVSLSDAFWVWWGQLGVVRYALVGLTAVLLILSHVLTFVLARNAAFERALPTDISLANAAVANTSLQRELDADVIQQLSSRDPRELDVAFRTARVMKLRSPYIRDIAERFAATARDRAVRDSATAFILDSPDATASFERVSTTRQLRAELGTPDIRRMLEDADAYVRGDASNGATEAVRLYSEILKRLSPEARSALRAENLAAAQREYAAGRVDEAAIRFKDLFADLGITDEASDSQS